MWSCANDSRQTIARYAITRDMKGILQATILLGCTRNGFVYSESLYGSNMILLLRFASFADDSNEPIDLKHMLFCHNFKENEFIKNHI